MIKWRLFFAAALLGLLPASASAQPVAALWLSCAASFS
jgi:hypothetical protein